MDIRAIWEEANKLHNCLSHLKTTTSRRRHPPEEDEDVLLLGDEFLKDKVKGAFSKTSRVASWKTQVFTFPETPLIRTRSTHMQEVDGTSIMAAQLLGLNTNLMSAAALLHDVGHTPFGHQGEMWMQEALGKKEFCHEIMGVVICQKIERAGFGLNLTWHVLRMIARNATGTDTLAKFPELDLLGLTDSITYLLHDANDIGNRTKLPFSSELCAALDYFGKNHRQRLNTLVSGLVIESEQAGQVVLEYSEIGQKFRRLRQLMYDEVYHRATNQDVERVMSKVLKFLKRLDITDPFMLLALMTDKDVEIMAERPMPDMQAFNRTSVSEIVPRLGEIHYKHGKIDLCDPDLNW